MKLQRRFDWLDRESVYKRVDENEVERSANGLVRFVAVRASNGNQFTGVSYESTCAAMCDNDFWKLAPNPKNPEKSIVVKAELPLPKSEETKLKALSEELNPTAKHKRS